MDAYKKMLLAKIGDCALKMQGDPASIAVPIRNLLSLYLEYQTSGEQNSATAHDLFGLLARHDLRDLSRVQLALMQKLFFHLQHDSEEDEYGLAKASLAEVGIV